jgi:hypothetical protein
MNFPNAVPVGFGNPERIVGAIRDFPGKTKSFNRRINRIQGIYLKIFSVKRNDLAIPHKRE